MINIENILNATSDKVTSEKVHAVLIVNGKEIEKDLTENQFLKVMSIFGDKAVKEAVKEEKKSKGAYLKEDDFKGLPTSYKVSVSHSEKGTGFIARADFYAIFKDTKIPYATVNNMVKTVKGATVTLKTADIKKAYFDYFK